MASRRDAALTVVRIADRRHKLLDGYGALLYGGRWNSPGCRVVYASQTHACAMLEIIAHANTLILPRTLVWAEIQIPDGVATEEVAPEKVAGWDREGSRVARQFGDDWYDSQRSLALMVPSVVSRPDRNVLINQNHRDFSRIVCGPARRVVWDRRILERLKGSDRR